MGGDDISGKQKALSGGELLSAISTSIVSILRENYGRGPTKAKTYVLDDLVVCVLRNGFTALEETMMAEGKKGEVVEMRHEFQKMMGARYKEKIEELTGRNVVAFLSQAHIEPDITLEVFMLDAAAPGVGAVELITPDEGQIATSD
jgi:uncharacterized protein YbcI